MPQTLHRKGEGIFWHVQVGDRTAEIAVLTFRNPPGNGLDVEERSNVMNQLNIDLYSHNLVFGVID